MDGDVLTVESVTSPANGTAVILRALPSMRTNLFGGPVDWAIVRELFQIGWPIAGTVAVDPSGLFAAVGGSRVTIWDLTRGERVVAVAEEVNAMAWSACDGTGPCRLVTAGEAIIVWEPDTGRRVELADQTNAQAVDITDDGETIADSTFIRWHLEKKYGIDFDRGLGTEQRATAWAFEKMLEDHAYWTVLHARWVKAFLANWPEGTPAHRSYFNRITSGAT